MKLTVNIFRWIAGLLFIFSGFIKGIDPRGLAYKMQEFFEVWSAAGYFKSLMNVFHDQALLFAIIMIALEILVGVALILGWQRKWSTWLLLLLMLFFTFLTSYVLFSGKIKACGCFGDCVPLTPKQTFTKDIILLIIAIVLVLKWKLIEPLSTAKIRNIVMLIATVFAFGLQYYVLNHLPLIDCLPFKKGNNILELRKVPANAIPDSFAYKFTYSKDGQKQSFNMTELPDSTWTFVEREQVLVRAGKNNIPLINDFSLTNVENQNVTDSILGQQGKYFIIFMREIPSNTSWANNMKTFVENHIKQAPVYIVTSQREKVNEFLNANKISVTDIFTADGTAIKTAARTVPTIYKMNGAVIENKWGWPYFDQIN